MTGKKNAKTKKKGAKNQKRKEKNLVAKLDVNGQKKYKKSINCRKPKGFSQKQYCKYGKKTQLKFIIII